MCRPIVYSIGAGGLTLQINVIRIILYMPPIGHMDWIGYGSAFRSSLWIWLDWVTELMDWIRLDLENWTHAQLCILHRLMIVPNFVFTFQFSNLPRDDMFRGFKRIIIN